MLVPVSVTLLGLSSIASAHMAMSKPEPFSKQKYLEDMGPVKSIQEFPCKHHFYDDKGAGNIMPLGSSQPLQFVGSAVHGGGSCQISVTYDLAPTPDSKFKVIHSIMGGCPTKNMTGNGPNNAMATDVADKYQFPVPENLPPGDAVVAWTWFNSVGDREMYMDCAPVTFTGPAGKRDLMSNETLIERGMEFYDSLPDMFVANIGGTCTVPDGNLEFPNPGSSVEKLKDVYVHPVGCGSSSSASQSAPNVAPAQSPSPPPATANSGSSSNSNASPATTPQPLAANASSTATSTNTMPSNNPVDPASSAPSSADNSDASGESSHVHSVPSDSKNAAVGVCSQEGAWNCPTETSYQRCASGVWSPAMPMAEGTTCQLDSNKVMKIGHARRFSRIARGHLHRHLSSLKFKY